MPISDVNAAVQRIGTSSKGRLPTLEGFVQQSGQPIEGYDKGYFECTFQVSPSGTGTLVRVSAKVTAWFSDPDPAQSGYRVLVSNGRLEDDALDRIADVLTPSGSAKTSSKTAPPPLPGHPFGNTSRPVQDNVSTAGTGANFGVRPISPVNRSAVPRATLPSAASLDPSKPLRTAEEIRSQELFDYVKNMEEIQRNQSHPNDLAAVKKPKTPIFAKPSEASQVLMEADAQDEFQVLGVDGAWVHVQISGLSRGWVHRGQLEMPVGFAASGATPETPSADAAFKIAKEETTSFRGNWQPLKGKPVRIEWIEPANPAVSTSPKDKLGYARSIFLRAFRNLAQAQPSAEGIIVVFDSADGGQIAASLSSVRALADHSLSEAAFWRQCSLDPPESFIDSAKP